MTVEFPVKIFFLESDFSLLTMFTHVGGGEGRRKRENKKEKEKEEPRWRRNRTGRPFSLLEIHQKNN